VESAATEKFGEVWWYAFVRIKRGVICRAVLLLQGEGEVREEERERMCVCA
jgi:hypothetical protein